jgi:hypothetical protein
LGDRRVSIIRVVDSVGAGDNNVAAGAAGTRLSWIDAILGCVAIDETAAQAAVPTFRKNVAQNASGSEGDSPGVLAVETATGDTGIWEVTLLGKP